MRTIHLPATFAALALLAAVFSGPAQAQARSLADCEKISDWHAYNLCLSSFGPARGQRAAAGRASNPESRVYGRKQGARRSASGIVVQRAGSGRVRASFDVGAPRRSTPR
jgi:hypothetical protein